MHFIQNSWFVVYSVWLLLMMLGVIGIIAYVHNRPRFLKRVLVYFTITFMAALTFSFHNDNSILLNNQAIRLTEIRNNENEVESPSILNNAFRFLGTLLKDKISN